MNLIESNLLNKVSNFLNNNIQPQGATVLVGLSGGPDSTALLLALYLLQERYDFKIIAAYVNHGMRDPEELNNEDQFVEKLARQYCIELQTLKIDQNKINQIAQNEKRSSEDVAREFRYNFFNDILAKHGQSYLALGHNLDDQYETMITRFFQGSGVSGLKGIPHNRENIIRPLISCRKKEIIAFLDERKQKYLIDPSNKENDYLRNQVRNKLLPVVHEIFPGYAKSLLSLKKTFSDLDQYQNEGLDKIELHTYGSGCDVDLVSFNKSHKVIRLKLLFKMFDYTYSGKVKSFRVPERFFHSLISDSLVSDRSYAEAYGVKFYTGKNKLVCHSFIENESGFYYILDKSEVIIPGACIFTIGSKQNIEIEYKAGSSLICRSVLSRDFILLEKGKTSISRIFDNWDVEDSHKNLIPVIADSMGIIAILGETQGYKNIFRNKKINFSEKFNILYLGVTKILQE